MWKKLRALIKILIVISIILTLSNIGKGHAQPTGFDSKQGKFEINRELKYNIKGWDSILESVEILNDNLMALHFCITNNTGKDQSTWVPKDYKSTVYITDSLGNKYPALDFQGITMEPHKTRVPGGKLIRYSLIFSVLKEGTRVFSFTEGGYVFNNIQMAYGQGMIATNPVTSGGIFRENRGDPSVLLSKSEFIEEKEIIRIDEYIEFLKPKLDQNTGVRFSYLYKETWSPFGPPGSAFGSPARTPERRKQILCRGYEVPVVGEVPPSIDLTDETVVKEIMNRAKEYAFSICPNLRSQKQHITVMLYPDRFSKSELDSPLVDLHAPIFGRFSPNNSPNYDLLSNDFKNDIAEEAARKKRLEEQRYREEVIRAAELARQKEEDIRLKAKAEKRRIEEEKKRQEVLKRHNQFVAKNGVKEWAPLNRLIANPFVYEGKTIGVVVHFSRMLSATQGFFTGNDIDAIVVSDVPRGLFTSKALVVLAGRVLGNIETQLPILGKTMAPHLKFVGVYFCKDWNCEDILPTTK